MTFSKSDKYCEMDRVLLKNYKIVTLIYLLIFLIYCETTLNNNYFEKSKTK